MGFRIVCTLIVNGPTPLSPVTLLTYLNWLKTNTAYRALDARINFFTNYYSISPGMISQTPGLGRPRITW